MRQVKSVLVMAGTLIATQELPYMQVLTTARVVLVMAGGQKRSSPELPEALALIRAMQEANVPRFLAQVADCD